MPLAFDSINHGSIAFGFFNIESDMLLLEDRFFFADGFCRAVCRLSEKYENQGVETRMLRGYGIDRRDDIGDLMGAIHGIRHTGFIGELYRLFPFPKDPGAFKQNPDGFKTREQVIQVISTYGRAMSIPMGPLDDQTIRIGDYWFDIPTYQALINYVWNGGYPRWKDGRRPGYVLAMGEAVLAGRARCVRGISLDQ